MVVIMRDAVMPECCKTCVCSEGYGCGITGTLMTTKEMESRPDWCPLEEVEPCEDAVPRTSVEYICRKNTVSTNPYEHKYHDKFIQFMDDPEISDFGRWQHSNGFNTALVAVKCDLDKVPSVTPKAEPCEDAVSKEAVSSWLKQYGQDVLHGKYKFSLMYIWKNLMDLPSVTPEQRWILCSKTVDIPDHEILACDKYGKEMFGYLAYEDEQWLCESDGCVMFDPIAWREKPEPYREEGVTSDEKPV